MGVRGIPFTRKHANEMIIDWLGFWSFIRKLPPADPFRVLPLDPTEPLMDNTLQKKDLNRIRVCKHPYHLWGTLAG